MNEPLFAFHDLAPALDDDFRSAVREGLSGRPRSISPKFFYDERGSELFDAICDQPEYYPTRTEMALLERIAPELAERTGGETLLVELGSGASRKVRLLLESLRPAGYLGVDISREFLLTCTRRLADDYPWLAVTAACVDYSGEFRLPLAEGQTPLAFFPGSSIGNFHPDEARGLLRRLHTALGPGAGLLIGVDVKKDKAVLDAAYNDAAGVTAAFNLNLLTRMRRELGARVTEEGFEHHAFYNEAAGRVEMHLRSRGAQVIELDGVSHHFADGETIHTECSYKYAPEEFRALAAEAGYAAEETWQDADGLFSLHFLRTEWA